MQFIPYWSPSSKRKSLILRRLLSAHAQKAELPIVSIISGAGARGLMLASAAPITEAPPVDPKLTGMGALPFAWYDGAVPDLELFGDGTPLETDEVASAPDVSIVVQLCPTSSSGVETSCV